MVDPSETTKASYTFYDILEVSSTAPLEVIKSSYQKKARQLHPDKRIGKENDADVEPAFLTLQRAWECLRDPAARKEYDAELAVKRLQKSKSQELSRAEWELVEEEESGDLSYVYECRCGCEIWLPEATLQTKKDKQNSTDSVIYVTCSGCSLAFHVAR